MRITQVELTNIKSYRHAVVPLHGGTTAIRGRNGAGKTTLVEAIGFALFDALSYKQAQFVREGERSGSVVVTFTSAFDDREYQVVRRCSAGAAASDWYAYDPLLGARIAEQKADMLAFLRQHMRIEGEMALDALFTDAIGVPQGTFTQDFLMTPALRKKKFDTLLQIEDYRKAAERLNETRNHLQDQRREQQKRIDDLERETGQLDAWRQQREEATRQAREWAERLQQIEREAAQVEARREQLRRQQAEVARRAAAAQVAAATRTAAEGRAGEAELRAEEARAAVRICQATRADHEAHAHTERALAAARERARERDTLLAERAEMAQRLEGASRDLGHLQRQLDEARAAEKRIGTLAGAVKRQDELECQRTTSQRDVDRLEEAERSRERLRQEAAQAEGERAEARRKIAALDMLRAEAEQLATRREQMEALQAAHAAFAQREQRHTALLAEQDEAGKKRAQLVARERKEQENVHKIEERRVEAERAPELEAAYAETEREVRRLETSIEHARAARTQSGAGQCPFLGEPCLNIQRKGENNLGVYFDRLISADELSLAPARRRLDALQRDLEHVREVRHYFDRLEEYQERLRQAADDRAQADARLARLADERAHIERTLAAGPTAQALDEARARLNRGLEADRRRSALPELQAVLARAETRREALSGEMATLERHLAALKDAPARLSAIVAALRQLGDPKSEHAGLQRVASDRPRLEAGTKTAAASAAQLQTELAKLDGALRPFASLDEELRRLAGELERAREGHTRYLQHEQLAARQGELEQTLAQAARERAAAVAAHETAQKAHGAADAAFDAAALDQVSRRADDLGAERGSTTEALRHTQAEAARLAGEIARVEQLLQALAAARTEQGRLEELERVLQQFRETIKEAGPYILKAVLRAISVEANRIFGEILGDRSAQLSWEQDYEIVLRRDGRERTFAQLSGGEQMSAALAVRLALLRGLTRLDMAFFDEPTQNMDGERRGNLAEQIRRVRGFDQLLVISHDDTFEQGLDSVIHLDKRGGETVLVEDEVYAPA
jgi:exonuclease SbcC